MGDSQVKSNLSAVVLFSGGLDSTVLLAASILQHEHVYPLFFTYPSRHNYRELKAAQQIALHYDLRFRTLPIPTTLWINSKSTLMNDKEITTSESTIVPFRNGVMLSMAAAWADNFGFDIVTFAAHKTDEPYPDCRPEFVGHMSLAIYEGTEGHITLEAPFLSVSKRRIAESGQRLGVPFKLTWSCYVGGEKHCGKCPACVERRKAFKEAQVDDPTLYSNEG